MEYPGELGEYASNLFGKADYEALTKIFNIFHTQILTGGRAVDMAHGLYREGPTDFDVILPLQWLTVMRAREEDVLFDKFCKGDVVEFFEKYLPEAKLVGTDDDEEEYVDARRTFRAFGCKFDIIICGDAFHVIDSFDLDICQTMVLFDDESFSAPGGAIVTGNIMALTPPVVKQLWAAEYCDRKRLQRTMERIDKYCNRGFQLGERSKALLSLTYTFSGLTLPRTQRQSILDNHKIWISESRAEDRGVVFCNIEGCCGATSYADPF